jgi:hydrogenase-1 operon protein HyaF
MAWSILAEISHMLATLCEQNRPASISLRSLPMTGADRRQLEDLLGKGEVRAELELAGLSEVWETRYAGVWWIRHQGTDGKVACEEIAITPIPEILISHPVDIRASAKNMEAELNRVRKSGDESSKNEQYEVEARHV